MRFPSLSDLEPEQIQAIGEAREKGSALFRSNDIIYTILSSERGFIVSAVNAEGINVGYIKSGPQSKHYAIEVPPDFRGHGIGTTLLRTKEAMNGILSHDWSGRYSRILFLIKRGYIPTKKVHALSSVHRDKKISRTELSELVKKLQSHVHEKLSGESTDDISPLVFRLNYFPGKAREFVQKYGLQ